MCNAFGFLLGPIVKVGPARIVGSLEKMHVQPDCKNRMNNRKVGLKILNNFKLKQTKVENTT